MIYHAHEVQIRVGHPSQEPIARDALVAGWRAIIDRAVPFIPASSLEAAVSEKREDARAALRAALSRLEQQLAADPTLAEGPPVLPMRRAGLLGGWGRPESANQGLVDLLGGVDNPSAKHVRETIRSYVYLDSLQAWNHHEAIRVLRAWAAFTSEPLFDEAADLLDAYSQALGARLDDAAQAYRQGMDMGDATASRLELMPEISRRAMALPSRD